MWIIKRHEMPDIMRNWIPREMEIACNTRDMDPRDAIRGGLSNDELDKIENEISEEEALLIVDKLDKIVDREKGNIDVLDLIYRAQRELLKERYYFSDVKIEMCRRYGQRYADENRTWKNLKINQEIAEEVGLENWLWRDRETEE